MDHQQKTFSLYAGSWLMAHAPIDLTHDMRLRNQEKKMYSGRYELCAGKCTVEVTCCNLMTSLFVAMVTRGDKMHCGRYAKNRPS